MAFTDYFQYRIKVLNGPDLALEDSMDIVLSEISDLPFDSFETEGDCILAYVPCTNDSPDIAKVISAIPGVDVVEKTFIKGENWNAIWESSFEPITVGDKIIVRAPFHQVVNNYEHEIIIEPKMAFGTGHHSTTRLMMESMLHLNLTHQSVLDMGCGTGILAILAAKLGAAKITAVDNDPQCIINSVENCELNSCTHIEVYENDKISANFKTDIILANIQKNVLIEQMPSYKKWLHKNGKLLVSGIYEEAVSDVIAVASGNGLNFITKRNLNEWYMLEFSN